MAETINSGNSLLTPILFMVFNRLYTTKKVFNEIRKARPKKLYIASDGPRINKDGENFEVEAVRDFLISNIDWECEVKTFFREKNLGCKYACSGAIDWFFENEDMGIVLEDDTLPNESFFSFCEIMLNKYKDDFRIGFINGTNFQNGIKRGDGDYYFSIFPHVWGWASWSNRWKNYDVEMNNFESPNFIKDIIKNKKVYKSWCKSFYQVKVEKFDTWDYQFAFALWSQKQLCINPNTNLIKNIGFDSIATHTKIINEFAKNETKKLYLKNHPEIIKANTEADKYFMKKAFIKPNIFKRILNKIYVKKFSK